MNYLICSVGRRVNLVKWFKEELNKRNLKCYATDQSKYAPALYFANNYFVENDIDIIIERCKENNITNIISLHDRQIYNYSMIKKHFELNGLNFISSDSDIIDMCYDKNRYTELPINQVPTCIVKDQYGSAGSGFQKIKQPLIEGTEYNCQCYFDIRSKHLLNVFMQEKLSSRAGETDKSISIWDDEIFYEIKKLDGLFKGVIDIDVIKSDEVYIIDINPRFGGGYPLAHHCGMNYVSDLIDNIDGKQMTILKKYNIGVTMMKYNGLLFKE